MFSQTLGIALGDWMADDTGLGYHGSALLIAVVLAVVAVAASAALTVLMLACILIFRRDRDAFPEKQAYRI
jgi:uncharacterized membrane-anchored protein